MERIGQESDVAGMPIRPHRFALDTGFLPPREAISTRRLKRGGDHGGIWRSAGPAGRSEGKRVELDLIDA
jgi:hypothetical protein